MSWFSKVAWSEGLFLRPQHFQQHDRHVDWLIDARTRQTGSNAWGFSSLELDEQALTIGKVAITSAAGILPDGTPFDFPGAHDGPLAVDFPQDAKDTLVCLALPMRRPLMAEYSVDDQAAPLVRFDVVEETLPDSGSSGMATEIVQICQPRLVLGVENTLSDAFVKLGVVRVTERRPDKTLLLDRSYIPPMLAASASPPLKAMLHEIVGLLTQRADALIGRVVHTGHGGVAEIADFMLLATINRHLPLFEHLTRLAPLHPERLYVQMLELMGDLAALTTDSRRPISAPAYEQDALRATFDPVMREIRRGLSAVLEQNAVQIELQDHKQGRYVGVIADKGLMRQAGFVLAVNAQMPGEALRGRFPTQAKIGPVERIRELVNLQLPGIVLRPLPVAPRQIPFHAGFTYFELESSGDLWQQVETSGGLGMYVTGDFPGLEVSLWAIRA